ncbi:MULTISPECIES: carbohydrate ABC transporter permease [Nocardiopsis]|jgi:multiple sugar transport system permease protein/trehalose/maltose transport system permease protein|nr:MULTISPECIES: sugar ABC transporter permease [Nocardiopsis]APC36817.1 ABC transporter permease [Nocardiopsis dassonvillei]ASU59759.1 sugar ABC transporter permease [Nocardiopsis dassonvillei]MCK9870152.1 sugar ABC transporter permease [Nocardiopsis dassonvillei]NKY78012.1 sugar ABC transporter permease [Nocardiopsis dassonvillei]WDZ93998.1 sugar ABC transporter permease [Nocardiopsis sp. HUAS JQ3]
MGRIFLAPSFAFMAVIALFPVFYAIGMSLYEIRGFRQEFTGVDNYVRVLTDSGFFNAVWNTLVFTVASVSLEFLVGMAFALIMHQAFLGRGLTRAVILIPWVIPTAVAAQVWRFMFDPNPGFVNAVLGTDINWLRDPFWSMVGIISADVWKTAPFVALLLLAGLQTIPKDYYEAARVDGANALQRFWNITLPLLRPSIVVALLFRTVDALRMFDFAYVFTGYSNSLATLSVYAQRYLVRDPDLGYANALSTVTFVIVMLVGLAFISRMGRHMIGEAPRKEKR